MKESIIYYSGFLEGVLEASNFIESIDEDYNAKFFIKEHDAHSYKVTLYWNAGCSIDDDEKVINDENYFIICKNESYKNFVKEINEMIELMVSKPFDSELEDFEFNQLNND